jgi:ribosome-associated toxin RatA of RatAB toxin-antitoxin module
VPSIDGAHSELIDASRQRCLELLLDVGGYPRWYDTLDAVEVLSRDRAGRVDRARLTVEVPHTRLKIELALEYELPDHIRAVQTGGNGHVEGFSSAWHLEAVDGTRTRAAYRVAARSGSRAAGVLFRTARRLVEHDLIVAFPQALKAAAERRS